MCNPLIALTVQRINLKGFIQKILLPLVVVYGGYITSGEANRYCAVHPCLYFPILDTGPLTPIDGLRTLSAIENSWLINLIVNITSKNLPLCLVFN